MANFGTDFCSAFFVRRTDSYPRDSVLRLAVRGNFFGILGQNREFDWLRFEHEIVKVIEDKRHRADAVCLTYWNS